MGGVGAAKLYFKISLPLSSLSLFCCCRRPAFFELITESSTKDRRREGKKTKGKRGNEGAARKQENCAKRKPEQLQRECWRGKELGHGAIPTIASTRNHWQSSLSGNACLDYGMCAVLFFFTPLNSFFIFASPAVLVIPPCPEAASEKYYSQYGRGGQQRGGEELWES